MMGAKRTIFPKYKPKYHEATSHKPQAWVMSITAALFMLLSNIAFAQVNTPTELQQSPTTEPTKTRAMELYDEAVARSKQPKESECTAPTVNTISVVRYKTHAHVYANFDMQGQTTLLLRNSVTGKIYPAICTNGEVHFERVELEQTYELLTKNSCGDVITLSGIKTSKASNNVVMMTVPLFQSVSNWSTNPNGIPLDKFLHDLKNVDYYERLSYYQQQYLRNELVDDDLPLGEFPDRKSEKNVDQAKDINGATCDCVYAVTGQENYLYGVRGTPVTQIQNISNTGNINWEQTQYEWGAHLAKVSNDAGAAKTMELYTNGHCDRQDYEFSSSNRQNGRALNDSWLGFSLTCIGYNKYPENCVCEKNVYLRARYETDLEVALDASSVVYCGWGASAYTYAEDAAALIVRDYEGGAKLLAFDADAHYRGYSGGINATFLSNYLAYIGSAAQILLATQGGTSTTGLTPTLITDLITRIQTLIQTPPTVEVGETGGGTKKSVLIDYQNTLPADFRLKANYPVQVHLMSWSSLQGGGATDWHTASIVRSRYNLGGLLEFATKDPDHPECCSDPLVVWNASPGANGNKELQKYFRLLWPSLPEIRTDWGIVASTIKDCIPALINPFKKPNNTPLESLSFKQQVEGIYVYNSGEEVFDYLLSDLNGRVLQRYKGNASNGKVFSFDAQYPAGVYLLEARASDGAKKSFKIFKAN